MTSPGNLVSSVPFSWRRKRRKPFCFRRTAYFFPLYTFNDRTSGYNTLYPRWIQFWPPLIDVLFLFVYFFIGADTASCVCGSLGCFLRYFCGACGKSKRRYRQQHRQHQQDGYELDLFHKIVLSQIQISSFCIGSQLEFALQAAPWCRGAGDSKSADVPLGGERPRCYLPSIFIMYKFDVQLPFSRCRRCRWMYPARSKSLSALCTVRGERCRSWAMVFTPGQQLPPPARSRRYI